MVQKTTLLLWVTISTALSMAAPPAAEKAPTVALTNGRWFNGTSFTDRTLYSVDGRFTSRRPPQIDRTIDLAGKWVVPPFADAHNHNIGTGVEQRDKDAILRYLAEGVFYVKIQGNLPLTSEALGRLSIGEPSSVDVVLAQGSLTATGGWPIPLVEDTLLPQGYFPGYTKETLKDHRYFTIDSEAELDKKWPVILGKHPDFIKTFLSFSDGCRPPIGIISSSLSATAALAE